MRKKPRGEALSSNDPPRAIKAAGDAAAMIPLTHAALAWNYGGDAVSSASAQREVR
jgi:hypothetical protein